MAASRGHDYGPKGARVQTCSVCGVQRWSNKLGAVYHLPHGAYGKSLYEVKGTNREPPCRPVKGTK